MRQIFVEGGLIRKLWTVEIAAYRDHLLRLDPDSRRNRFGGTIGDDMVRSYAATADGGDVIIHGFFVDGVLRGVADLRIAGREAEAAFSTMASARRCSNAVCSLRATAASSSCRSAALWKTSACSSSPANSRRR